MATIGLDTQLKDLLGFYREEKRIYGRCPLCREAFRLSEVKLTYGKEAPRDLLGRLERERTRLKERLEAIEAEMEELEGEHEAELDEVEARWRSQVDLQVEKHLQKKIKDIRRKAIEHSRVSTLGKTIERIAPMFSGFGHHPGDVRPIFEPLDFVSFEGLYTGDVSDVVFIEFKTGGSTLTHIQRTIRDAVARKRVHFEERRMPTAVIRSLATGRALKRGAGAIESNPQR